MLSRFSLERYQQLTYIYPSARLLDVLPNLRVTGSNPVGVTSVFREFGLRAARWSADWPYHSRAQPARYLSHFRAYWSEGAGAIDAGNNAADAVFRGVVVDINPAAAEQFRRAGRNLAIHPEEIRITRPVLRRCKTSDYTREVSQSTNEFLFHNFRTN